MKKTYFRILVAVTVLTASLGLARSASAATYYISVADGNDTNCTGLASTAYTSGSGQPCPWKTLAKVRATALSAGDSVLFKRGETFTGYLDVGYSGSAGNPITFADYGTGALPILNSNTLSTITVWSNKSYVTFTNLQVQNGTNQNIQLYDSDNHLTFNNITSVGNTDGLVSSSGSFTYITVNGFTTSGLGATKSAMILTGSTVSNLTISNVTSSGGNYGIFIEGSSAGGNVSISDSTFSNNVYGLVIQGVGSTFNVTRVTASSNSEDGLDLAGSVSGVIFDHCISENNGGAGTGSAGDGFSFHGSSSGIIRYSISRNNLKTAVAHINTTQVQMYYNLFYHTTNGSLGLVYLDGGTYTLYNNVIYSDAQTGDGIYLTTNTTTTIKNNIVKGFDRGIYKGSGTITEDYNDVYGAATANFSGLTAGSHSLQVNPLFTDGAGRDFTLQGTSPLINAGVDVSLSTDYAGTSVPQGTSPDLGAYEYALPTAPTIGTPTALSSSAIRWNFTDNSSIETGFKLYNNNNALVSTTATPNLSYVDETGLAANTLYAGRYVTAYNAGGNSSNSSTASAYTKTPAPTNFVTSANSTSVTVRVDAFPNDTSGQSGYYFARTGGGNSGWIQTPTWTESGLSCGTAYTYTVKYRNGDAVESTSLETSVTTSGCRSGGGFPISDYNPRAFMVTASTSPLLNQEGPTPPAWFTEHLTPNQISPDVKRLQVFLNRDPETKIAATGPGSPGRETNYFGALTKRAVIRFQEKYADEILKPWGFKNGTGLVWETTLSKINQLINQSAR
jgi:hypothetical protein